MSDMQQFIAAYSINGAAPRTILGPPDPSTRPVKQAADKPKKKKSALFHPFQSKKKGKDSTPAQTLKLPHAQSPRARDDNSDTSSVASHEPNFHDRQRSFDVALGRHGSEWSMDSQAFEGALDSYSGQDSLSGYHSKSASLNSADDVEPLPPGWSCAITKEGAIYFINEVERTTTWVDPRTVRSLAKSPAATPDYSQQPLPEGWEMAYTPEGVPYYIDHKRKATSWTDPRSIGVPSNNNVNNMAPLDQEKARLRLKQLKLASEELELQLTLIRKQQESLEVELDQRTLDGISQSQLQAQADAKAMFAHEEMNLANQYSALQSQFAQLQGKIQGSKSSHRYTASDPLGQWGNTHSSRAVEFEHSKLRHLADLKLDAPATPSEPLALEDTNQQVLPDLADLTASDLGPLGASFGGRNLSDILNGDIPPEFDEYLGSWC